MAQGYMEIGEPWLSIIVTVAGVLILSGWVQQLVKGYRTKSLKDISRYLLLLILAGATLWLIYGFAVGVYSHLFYFICILLAVLQPVYAEVLSLYIQQVPY